MGFGGLFRNGFFGNFGWVIILLLLFYFNDDSPSCC